MTTEQTVDKIIDAHHQHNLGKIDYGKLYFKVEYAVMEAYDLGAMEATAATNEVVQKAREALEEVRQLVSRLELEMAVVVCDCGEPYSTSDASVLVDEISTHLDSLYQVTNNTMAIEPNMEAYNLGYEKGKAYRDAIEGTIPQSMIDQQVIPLQEEIKALKHKLEVKENRLQGALDIIDDIYLITKDALK